MEYLGYKATIEWSEEDKMYYGSLVGIQDYICFHGRSREECENNLRKAVNNYIAIKNSITNIFN